MTIRTKGGAVEVRVTGKGELREQEMRETATEARWRAARFASRRPRSSVGRCAMTTTTRWRAIRIVVGRDLRLGPATISDCQAAIRIIIITEATANHQPTECNEHDNVNEVHEWKATRWDDQHNNNTSRSYHESKENCPLRAT